MLGRYTADADIVKHICKKQECRCDCGGGTQPRAGDPSLFITVLSLFREYVSSKTINKVVQVHDQIFCCMAGSLADAQAVTKAAKFHLSFHRCHTRISIQ